MTVTRDQMLFSAKLFIAAMIAFTIAVHIGLPQPYWAMVTCCVCTNIMTGAVRSKGVFRMTGTVCAGIAALALAALFGSTPLLLIVAAGIAATVSFSFSYMDRTPRSYGFQLFSITLMIVAVAGVNHPETMFDTVVARVSEIGLGIIVTTLVDSVIAPRSMAGTLRASLQRWLPDMQAWADDIFSGKEQTAQAGHDRLRLLADIAALSQLTSALRYDPVIRRREQRYIFAIQQRLLRMTPLLSAIADRIDGLEEPDRTALTALLAEARDSLAAGTPPEPGLTARVRNLPTAADSKRPWHRLVHTTLADTLEETLTLWSEVRQIAAALDGKAELDSMLEANIRQAVAAPLPPDFGHVLRMGAGIGVSFAIMCGVWYATGWQQGANLVLLGTLALAFYGGGDEPGKAISTFGRFSVLSLALGGILAYGLLPLANDFPTFAIAMGVYILPLGAWASINPLATLLLATSLTGISLQGHYNALDFGSYLEGGVANQIGIFIAFLGASLFRSWGAASQIARFMHIEGRDIARLSQLATPRLRDIYIQRALDRIAAMTARLTATGQVGRSARLLARLRVGVNIANLRVYGGSFDRAASDATEEVLAQFRHELDQPQPSPELLARIDHALDTLWTKGAPAEQALRALAGLRIALFERAPAWIPAP